MIREKVRVSGVWRPKSRLAVYLLLGITALAIGVGLLMLRQHALSAIEAAEQWVPTPGVVERARFVRCDDGGRVLDLEYRYEFRGTTYRSTRLDLLPGRTGDDDSWEEQLLAQSPAGSEVTCYVDPANPHMAVLDREHGAAGAGALRLLAFSFLVISAAFLGAGAKRVFVLGRDALNVDRKPVEGPHGTLGDAPRRLKPGAALALLFAIPRKTQLAWAFLVGFAVVFTMLEGPAALSELWPADEERLKGEVTRVEQLQQREFMQKVYEVEFCYELNGKTKTGKSHTAGKRHDVGDSVDVVLNPKRPDSASIVDARRRLVPWWVTAIPLVVMLMLGLGIAGNGAFNWRTLRLARNGLVATGTLRAPSEVADRRGAAPPAATSKYEFRVDGQVYSVDPRSMITGPEKTIRVLYASQNPARNVGLDNKRWAILSGAANPWPTCLAGMLVPAVCVAALAWLWGAS